MIRIGVTGHRSIFDPDRLTAGVDRALAHIAQVYPGQLFTVYSSLAEGGDRFVVKRAVLHYAAKVIVPLPLPVHEYLADFRSEASVIEFHHLLALADRVIHLPRAQSREDAYWTAGMYILDHSDTLVAIWDGKEARGKGGVGEVVSEARRRSLSITWVQSPNRMEEKPVGPVSGKVIFENFC